MTAAATPLIISVVRSGDDFSIPIVLLCLTAGASLGWTVDDPAAEILDPLPIDHRFRLGLRLSVAATIGAVVVVSAICLLAVVAPGLQTEIPHRIPEMATAAAAAVGIGLTALRTGAHAVGPCAVAAGLLVPGLIAALAFRWPDTLPAFVVNHVHLRWWWFAAIGGALAIHLASSESA